MKWEYNDYRPEGFECWSAKWKENYDISVYRIGENRYSVGWYHEGCRTIKEYIDAKDWDEAKASAISIIGNYFHQMADYWKYLELRFIKWTREEAK